MLLGKQFFMLQLKNYGPVLLGTVVTVDVKL